MHATFKDEADIASEQEQCARNEALWRTQQPSRMQSRGRCYNCDSVCAGLFCDVDCRRDYERERAIRQRQGAQQSAAPSDKPQRPILRLPKRQPQREEKPK